MIKNGAKILIVDDSDFSRKVISSYFDNSPHQVIAEVASADAAIKILSEKECNIAIIDVVMPEIGGIELTESISRTFNNMAVIVISSLAQESIIMRSISAGAQDFIQKPFSENTLLQSVNKIWENRS